MTDKVAALHAELQGKVAELTQGDEWRRAMETAARFTRYSPHNVFLIMLQAPDATRVAGYKVWQGLGRQVRKGERGIRILAPCRYTKEDETTGERTSVVRGFTTATVFDVAQTDGEPLAEVRPERLSGDATGLERVAALITARGFTFTRGDCGDANGVTDFAACRVTVRDDIDPAQAVKTALHELGHVLMHAPGCEYRSERDRCEVEAESVAYIVGTALGLATDSYSLPYVAGWARGDVEIARATAERVIGCASSVLADLEPEQSGEMAA